MADYEVSAAYIDSLVRALREAGKLDAVTAHDGYVDALVMNPWSSPWQPAELLERLTDATAATAGEAFVEQTAYAAMKQRFGGIVVPMLKSSIAAGPGTLFNKLDSVVSVAIRGAKLSWQPASDESGAFTVAYPRKVSPNTGLSWRGVIRFIFEVTGKPSGRIQDQAQLASGQGFTYLVSW